MARNPSRPPGHLRHCGHDPDERRAAVRSGKHLPNDARRPGPLRRPLQRALPAPQTPPLPMERAHRRRARRRHRRPSRRPGPQSAGKA